MKNLKKQAIALNKASEIKYREQFGSQEVYVIHPMYPPLVPRACFRHFSLDAKLCTVTDD
jgi:TfoX/Sxy family transcriptional regulator of competence genes